MSANSENEDNSEGLELSGYILSIFESFKSARLVYEDKWRECQYNYLGQYQPHLKMKKTEGSGKRSRIFVKITTLKCNTAHARIVDAFLSGRKTVPFDVEAIPPEGIKPEMAQKTSSKFKAKLEKHFKLIELSERINDAVLETCILGTAVLKGPIIESRNVTDVNQRVIGGIPVNQLGVDINPYEISSRSEDVPVIDHIPLWEYYVDPNAKSTKDSIGEIHFQRLLPAHFMNLAQGGGYDKRAVLNAKTRATTGDPNDKRIEMMGDNYSGESGQKDKRVPVLEYWGLVPVGMLKAAGVTDIKEDVDDEDSVEALVVLAADGIVIKACLNPLGFRPFYVAPYKKIPHQIYGEGVAGLMRDSQKMINSATRLYIDNKALSGNTIIGLISNKIDWKRTGSLEIYPGKTFYFKDGANVSEVMSSIKIPDVTNGLREMIELFERFSDDETGIPKYSSGQQSSFLNKTASGISMLMTAANVNLKGVMQNIDDYWIEPIVEGFYQWFMEMDADQSMKIPLKIKATGSDSLMAKEIKLENLLKAKQVTDNTPAALFIDDAKYWSKVFDILEVSEVMRPDDQIEEILQEAAKQSTQGKDMRELLRVDAIFPLLSGKEQGQILTEMGIEPDPDRLGVSHQIAPGAASTTEVPSSSDQMPPGVINQEELAKYD